jgi:uncharacterized protein (DUF1330 family)
VEHSVDHFEFEALRDFPDRGPVTMLNLVKFREQSLDGNGSGRAAYERYSAAVGPLVEELGGKVFWAGVVKHPALHEGGDVEWDWSVLVYYPSRATFVEMIRSARYQQANRDRQNGVEKHIILASKTVLSLDYPDN